MKSHQSDFTMSFQSFPFQDNHQEDVTSMQGKKNKKSKQSKPQKSSSSIARRREQNRLAQARRRQRKESLIEQLQEKVNELRDCISERDRLILKLYGHLQKVLQTERNSVHQMTTGSLIDQENSSILSKGFEVAVEPTRLPSSTSTSSSTISNWQTQSNEATTFDQIMSDLNIESILHHQILPLKSCPLVNPTNTINTNNPTSSYEEGIHDSMSVNNSTPLSANGSTDETPSPQLQSFSFLPFIVDHEKNDEQDQNPQVWSSSLAGKGGNYEQTGNGVEETILTTTSKDKVELTKSHLDGLEKFILDFGQNEQKLLNTIVKEKQQQQQQHPGHQHRPFSITTAPSSLQQSSVPIKTWKYNLPHSL